MTIATRNALTRTAFVPHDIKAPIVGAQSGPLAGLSLAVKDMYDLTGEKTGGGNPTWLANAPVATKNAAAVQKLLDAGANVIGKTVCDEFFYSVIGINAHYGTPVNVRAKGRVPGGSSSGSASAVASGAADIGLGSDTGGSVRVPASFCGLYGIRPTHGRIDLANAMPMSPTFDTVGWFTAGPGLFRKVGHVLLDSASVPAEVTDVVVLEDTFAEADPAVVALLETALQAMAGDLPKQRRETIAPGGLDAWRDAVRLVQASEIWENFGAFVREKKPTFGPGVRERMEFTATVGGEALAKAQETRLKARDLIRALAVPGTVMVCPTAVAIAPKIDATAEVLENFRVRVQRITAIAGIGGLPQINIPVGTIEGCPAGLGLIGWPGGDEALLDLAVRLSRHCGIEM
jgi:amidase